MHSARARRFLSLLTASTMVLALFAFPAAADDDVDDTESEASVGGVEVEVHPAIVKPGHMLTLKAEYDAEDEADEGEQEGDEAEDSTGQPVEESDDAVESPEGGADGGDSVEEPAGSAETDDGAPSDGDAPEADEVRETPTAITYTVDWGDGSDPEVIDRPGKGNARRGGPASQPGDDDAAGDETGDLDDDGDLDDEDASDDDGDEDDDDRRDHLAIGKHRYADEGEYVATVTVDGIADAPVEVSVTVQVGRGSARLSGEDRFDTAERISREDFPTDGSADAVVLSRADSFADALASASLATLEHAPVLLVPADEIPAGVTDEIARALGESGTVYVLGGEAAIPGTIATELETDGYTVQRIAGADRIETSVKIAQFLVDAGAEFDTVVLANAGGFADALSGAAIAADEHAPVLLTGSDALDERVAAFLSTLDADTEVLAVGGEAVLTAAVLTQVEALGLTVERLAGDSRYGTSVEIAEQRFPSPQSVVVTTGTNFPDALAGAALAGRRSAPVLLVGDRVTGDLRGYLQANADTIESIYVLGGKGAVPVELRAELNELLRG